MAGRAKLVGQVVAVGLVAAHLGLLDCKGARGHNGGVSAQLARGESPAAPDFELPRLDREGRLAFSSLRGKAVVVNFWASWCIPCKDEAPVLEQTWREQYWARIKAYLIATTASSCCAWMLKTSRGMRGRSCASTT